MTTIYSKAGTDAAISAAIDALAPASIGAATAAQGAKADASDVHQITLTEPLVLTIPEGHPAGQVYRCAITQTTGGHAVTYGADIVMAAGVLWSVGTLAGSETVAVFRYSANLGKWVCEGVWVSVLGADTTAPSVGSMAVSDVTPTEFTLTVTGATDAGGSGVGGYDFTIDGVSTGYQTSNIYHAVGRAPNTGYSCNWRVRDGAGNVSTGTAQTVTTAADTTAPTWAATLTPGTPDTTSVVVAASALAMDNHTVASYEATLDGSIGSPVWSAIARAGLNFTLAGLTEGTTYASAKLRAKDAAGNASIPLAVPSFTTAASALHTAILSLSPVGYWKLNDASGATTALDSSGNGRNGTYSGAVTPAGSNGYALFAAGGRVTIPDDDDWSATNGLSIFFVTNRNAGVGGTVIAKAVTSNYEYRAAVGATGVLATVLWRATGNNLMAEGSAEGVIPSGSRMASCITFPVPSSGARIPLYAGSGEALTTTQGTITAGSYANGTAPLSLGGMSDGTDSYRGGLGHVAVFAGQLTPVQVAALMDAARADGLTP